jgi:hypothetical protein
VPIIVPAGGAAIVIVGAALHVAAHVVVVVPATEEFGAAIVIVGAALHVPLPANTIPVTTPLVTIAVAVTVLGQVAPRVTTGGVVAEYPVPH